MEIEGMKLHSAIIAGEFITLVSLLKSSATKIDVQNTEEDTLLLSCLKNNRELKYLKRLLDAGASIHIPNKHNITPISYVLSYRPDILGVLLRTCQNTKPMWDIPFSKNLQLAFKRGDCDIKTYDVVREPKHILVCASTGYPLCSKNVAVKELTVFLKEVESLGKEKFILICVSMLNQSLPSYSALLFKTVWRCADFSYLGIMYSRLLITFTEVSTFNNDNYTECLSMILNSDYALQVSCTHARIYTDFNQVLLYTLHLRDMCITSRILLLDKSTKLIPLTMKHIVAAYNFFGFEEAMAMLIQRLDSTIDPALHGVFNHFLLLLETNTKFDIENLQYLPVPSTIAYHKLLVLSLQTRTEHKLCLKEKIKLLNTPVTLFKLSTFAVQKVILKASKDTNIARLEKDINGLSISKICKQYLLQNPPFYYCI